MLFLYHQESLQTGILVPPSTSLTLGSSPFNAESRPDGAAFGVLTGYKLNAFSGIDGDCNADKRGLLLHPRFFYAYIHNGVEKWSRKCKI